MNRQHLIPIKPSNVFEKMASRRALWRWAWRLFQREWQQQLLVLLLITVVTAAAIAVSSAAYTLSPLANAPGQYGSANQAFTHSGEDAALLEENIAQIAAWFGDTDIIKRRYAAMPGANTLVEIRGQDPQGAFSAPMLQLLNGRYPTNAGEIAVTDKLAEQLQLEINTQFKLAETDLQVVGFVENPNDLRDEFMLMPPQFVEPQTVTILVAGTNAHFLAFPWPEDGLIGHEMFETLAGNINEKALTASVAMAISATAMVLVALVAATGFAIVAQRRQRQLGMLAAIGATERQLRGVMVANGAVVGLVAGVLGAGLGVVGWILAVPYLEETVVGARIDRFDLLPWWLIGAGILLAIAAAAWAAWLPARAIARLPIVVALSARPTQPKPPNQTVKWVGLLLSVGLTCLLLTNATTVEWADAVLLTVGALATITGTLLLSPLALQMLAATAGRMPIGTRLAWRDLARFQSRTATALAASTLVLGLAVVVVLMVARNEATAKRGNLSDDQLLVTEEEGRIRELVTLRSSAEINSQQLQLEQIVGALDEATLFDLQMAVDPAEPPSPGRDGNDWRNAVLIGAGEQTANPSPLFVATPALLRYYGINPDTLDKSIDILTIRNGAIGLRRGIEEQLVTHMMQLDFPAYQSAPTSLITLDALQRNGWEAAHAGWFIVSERPIRSQQLSDARRTADAYGFNIEARDGLNLATLRSLRSGTILIVTLIALSIFAITVTLIRSEAVTDLHILTATGATSAVRRSITASSAAGLAILGVILGTVGALTSLVAVFITELDTILTVSVWQLAAILIIIPLLAALVGWLLGGREPVGRVKQTSL